MFATQTHLIESLDRDGFALFKGVVSQREVCSLIESIETKIASASSCAPGTRHLLRQCAAVHTFAHSKPIREIAVAILGAGVSPVKAILFDKTPPANWYVTWHQDLTIAVEQRVDTPGFGPWSIKDGIAHVQPPAVILENMISLRIHLDSSSEENGAIKFIPGSHKEGILEPAEIASWRTGHKSISCPAERGDVIVMRPLILHSSSVSDHPDHRRVLHIEYAQAKLPVGLEWAEA